MRWDTFDHIPDVMRNCACVQEIILDQLCNLGGVILSGLAAPAFAPDVNWGAAIRLSSGETLQMRMYPCGLVSSGRLLDMQDTVVMIATRRRSNVDKDRVTFGIFWTLSMDARKSRQIEANCTSPPLQTVAARHLHIVLPSIFNHHDPDYGAAPEAKKPVPKWPVLSDCNFHALRPGSLSIHRAIKPPNSDKSVVTTSAAPGMSQFIIAGYFAGVDVEDVVHRSAEPLPYSKWHHMAQKYVNKIMTGPSGPEGGGLAMRHAITAMDLLTAEGLLGILSHEFCQASLPDMMHAPHGFPLLIAFAVRIACDPARYGLPVGMPADLAANREVTTLFESSWEPIKQTDKTRVYALADMKTSVAVADNMAFWQRAGQRCVTEVFGPHMDEFCATRLLEPYGASPLLVDSLRDARNRAMKARVPVFDTNTPNADGELPQQMASPREKRAALLMVLNSVEHWLRTGTYCAMQIHNPNSHQVGGETPRVRAAGDLRDALRKGVEESVREMVENGDSEADARGAAETLRESLEQAMAIEAADSDAGEPRELSANVRLKVPASLLHPDLQTSDLGEEALLDADSVCIEAYRHACLGVGAAICQGPIVHQSYEMSCFVSSPSAVNTCANCDAAVHVLHATFLGSKFGECLRCRRPRCLQCTETHKLDTGPCLRCKQPKKDKLDKKQIDKGKPAKGKPAKSKSYKSAD